MMETIKKFHIKRGTISKGLRDETYLLQEDVIKLIREMVLEKKSLNISADELIERIEG